MMNTDTEKEKFPKSMDILIIPVSSSVEVIDSSARIWREVFELYMIGKLTEMVTNDAIFQPEITFTVSIHLMSKII